MGLLSSFIRSLDDLIAQGYPPEVAERIVSGELDPSFEARMARASDRFDIENPEYTGSMELIGDVNTPIWSTQNPSLAATYANPSNGGNITPVFLDREGVSTVRADGTRWNNINDNGRSTNDYMRKAQDYGLPSVAFRDVRDVGPYTARYPRDLLEQAFQPSNTTVTLDPTKIRSINAMFDPEYTGPNILGATAGTAGVLGLLAAPQDAEAGMSKTAVQLLRDEANRLRFGDTDNAVDLSYRGSHQAPDADYGAPLYDLTQLIPDDIYGPRGERLYGLGDRAVDAEVFEQLRNARGNPDYETPIYRAVPPGVEDINIGDWVTTSREYARMHGENALAGDYDIIESTAPAKKLQSEGYPYEFGLLPMRPETVIGGGTALGLLAAPEEAEAGFVTRGGKTLLEAFHGSPHEFDRFSMDAIGTGEGAQAYGHGLYFADSEDLARGYRDMLSATTEEMETAAWALGRMRNDREAAIKALETGEGLGLAGPQSLFDDAAKLLRDEVDLSAPGGLYRTEIDVTPESLLDWDKPLSEQSEVVKGAAQNYFDLFRKDEGIADYLDPIFNDEYGDMTGKEFYQTLQNLYSEGYLETPIGNRAADDALYAGNIPAATSASLLDDSIRGIQYLDGSSRKAGEGTRNYVMFEDEPIRIVERGSADPRLLAGTAGAGLLGTAFAPDVRSALEEAGVIGDTLVPTKRPLGERAMGVVDRILTGLEVPQRGVQGLAATGYGLLSGENFDTAASRGADVVKQGIEESAREFGDYVFDMTGSPAAATAAYTTGIFGSPL